LQHVLLAILAKQAEKFLPRYLYRVEALDYPKRDISVYVRANNCTDNTTSILSKWIDENAQTYRHIEWDFSDVPVKVEDEVIHNWTPERLEVLCKIRNRSLEVALENKADFYFCVDVDNYLEPHTLKNLVSLNLPIVGPMLECKGSPYLNIHAAIDVNGYYENCPEYDLIRTRKIKGVIEVPVVHCTYLVRADCIPKLTYTDGTYRFDYVIFSHSARKAGIPQYVDNRSFYGTLEISN
jgi:hypothetical protein